MGLSESIVLLWLFSHKVFVKYIFLSISLLPKPPLFFILRTGVIFRVCIRYVRRLQIQSGGRPIRRLGREKVGGSKVEG